MTYTIDQSDTKQSIASALKAGERDLFFPRGTYDVPVSALSPGIRLPRGTALRGDVSGTHIHWQGDGIGLLAMNCQDVVIENIAFHHEALPSPKWQMHIDFRGCLSSRVSHCQFSGGQWAVRAGKDGKDRYGGSPMPCSDITIDNCYASGVAGPVFFTKYGGCIGLRIHDNRIQRFTENAIAVQQFPLDGGSSRHTWIERNIITDGRGSGIVLSGSSIWCQNNFIENIASDGSAFGVKVTTDPIRLKDQEYSGIWVTDNVVNGIIGGSPERSFGVCLEHGTGWLSAIQCRGNVFSDDCIHCAAVQVGPMSTLGSVAVTGELKRFVTLDQWKTLREIK